jgi:hypothetical protein
MTSIKAVATKVQKVKKDNSKTKDQQDDYRIERLVKFQKKMRKQRRNPWSLCTIPQPIANKLEWVHGETVAVKYIDKDTVQIRRLKGVAHN